MTIRQKLILPFIALFLVLSAILFIFKTYLLNLDLRPDVLMGANVVLFVLYIFSFLIQSKAAENPNPNVFIRSVIGGMMIKMFGMVIAVLSYVVSSGVAYSKRSVFAAMLLYLVYLGVEVMVGAKKYRRKK